MRRKVTQHGDPLRKNWHTAAFDSSMGPSKLRHGFHVWQIFVMLVLVRTMGLVNVIVPTPEVDSAQAATGEA